MITPETYISIIKLLLRLPGVLALLCFIAVSNISFGQTPDCSSAEPFCSGAPVTFPASTNTTAPTGPDYDCLLNQPNPAWYFLEIANPGQIEIEITNQQNGAGTGVDIDFIVWGPFTDPGTPCLTGLTSNTVVDCSYSSAVSETATIPNSQAGEYYLFLITNYSNQPTDITFNQTSGGGSTECCILSLNSTDSDCGQATGTATADLLGVSPFTYDWSTGETTQSISGLSAGWYSVTTSDGGGCTRIDSVLINDAGGVFGTFGTVNDPACGQSDGTIAINGSGGMSPYSYNWNDPNSQTTATATGLDAGNYSVTITDQNGCTAILDTSLASAGNLTSSITNKVHATCDSTNGSAEVIATGGTTPYSYLWSDSNNQTTSSVTGLGSGVYVVTVTDGNGCTTTSQTTINNYGLGALSSTKVDETCAGASDGSATVSVSGGSPPFTFQWSDSGSQTDSTATGLLSGQYSVTVTDSIGCVSTATVTIGSPPPFNISISPDTTICLNGSANPTAYANGGSSPFSFTWIGNGSGQSIQVSPATNSTYQVYASDANGCLSDTASIQVNLFPPISITGLSDQTICEGDTATISGFASGGNGNLSYSWNNGIGAGNTANVSPADTTIYVLTVTDGCETPDASDSLTVYIGSVGDFSFTADPATGCAPLPVTFNINADTIRPDYDYVWTFGDGSGNKYSTDSFAYHIYDDTQNCFNVSLRVTSDIGCSKTVAVPCMVDAYPSPIAGWKYNPTYPTNINSLINFRDESLGAKHWYWDLGDSTFTQRINFSHNYPDAGEYLVVQTVTNEYGCSDTLSDLITIDIESTFYIPDAFSPNGDGRNELFGPVGEYLPGTDYEFYIFNRWGDVIFDTEDLNEKWNGAVQNRGKIVPNGVYVYLIRYKDYSGLMHEAHGRVTLLSRY